MHYTFQNTDYLTKICNNQFGDDKASGFAIHRTKNSGIIKNMFGPNFHKKLIKDIAETYCCLIIGKTTYSYKTTLVTKPLRVVIQYYSSKN